MSLISPISQSIARQTATTVDSPTPDPVEAARTETAAPVENPGAVLDRDAFLKLLVAQLKYQDPTNPADSSQMLAQTSQLTMVDKLNEMSESFKSSLAAQQMSLAGTIVGKEVTFADADGIERSAVVETARINGDEISLVAGGYDVPFGSLKSVNAPTATTPPAGTPAVVTTPAAPATTPAETTPGAVATAPVATDPAATEPAAADAAADEPTTTEPATTEPATEDTTDGDAAGTD